MTTESSAATITKAAQPAVITKAKRTTEELLRSPEFGRQLQAALPKHLTADRMVRVVLTAAMKTPKLFQCTQESLFLAILNCAAVGLEPDGRRAHLIPFENKSKKVVECQLVFGYAGLCELVYRSGMISSIYADIICENDTFVSNAGQLEKHLVNLRAPRGNAYAAYAIVRFKDGGHMCEVMGREDIEKIRDASKGWQAYKKGFISSTPWKDFPAEMWKKTCVRRIVKYCPQNAEMARADDDDERMAIDIEPIIKEGQAMLGSPSTEASENEATKAIEPPAATETEPAKDAGAPAEPTAEEKAKAEKMREQLRPVILKTIKAMILDNKTTEEKLIAKAKAEKLPPWDKEPGYVPGGISELPTDTLAKLAS